MPEPDEPLPFEFEPADEPPTCWPTVRLTVATTPATGEVNVASLNDVCAEATSFWADVTEAVSAASAVAAAPASVSVLSLACAVARLALACARFACNDAESIVASTVPALTVWPSATRTLVTLPDTWKLTEDCTAGSIVPVADTVSRTVPRVALTSRLVGWAPALPPSRVIQ